MIARVRAVLKDHCRMIEVSGDMQAAGVYDLPSARLPPSVARLAILMLRPPIILVGVEELL